MFRPDRPSKEDRPKGIKSPIINEKNLTTTIGILSSVLELDRKQIEIIERFFKSVDKEYYNQDTTISALIYCIEILCVDRMSGYGDYKEIFLNQIESSMASIYNDVKENLIIPAVMNADDISPRTAATIIASYETQLRYQSVLLKKEKFSNLLSDLTSGSSLDLETSLKAFENATKELTDEFSKIRLSKSNMTVTSTNSSTFVSNQLYDAYKVETSPVRIFKTGLKMFNQMISKDGGFLSNKYHMFYANINNFKSTLLLYCAKWIMQYNGDLFKTDSYIASGKKPTVLFISLENPYEEDVSKLFTMVTLKNLKHLKSYEDAERIWQIKVAEMDTPISITMIHPPLGSFTFSELRKIINDLESDGYDVISVIIDYLECIAPEPEDKKMDNRILLMKHSEALHYLASREKKCVISAMQINRAGSGLLNEQKNQKKTDHVRKLGREHIGESYGIDKKTDFSAFINIESMLNDSTKKFFTIKRDKVRYERTDVEYFVHPLNGITLKEDVYLPDDETYSQNAISTETNETLNFHCATRTELGERGLQQLRELTESEVAAVEKEHSMEDILNDPALSWIQDLNSSDDSIVFNSKHFGQTIDPFELDQYKLIDDSKEFIFTD